MIDLSDARRKFKKAGIGFLKAELDLSLSFARAAMTASNPDKIERNKQNALAGYETILHFLDELPLDSREVAEIRGSLDDLKVLLTRLHVI